VNLMQSIGKGPKKQIPAEELQKLKSAASRPDQMLKAAANADQQALKSAAARLDQLLSAIRAGKTSPATSCAEKILEPEMYVIPLAR
jgi:hypothetical protein